MAVIFKNRILGRDSVCLLLYGYIGEREEVDSGRVVSELMELAAEYGRVDIRINSKGGDVFSGIAIFNALRNVQADIHIYIDGVAASIASIIALCGKPLHMSRYARLMLHRVSGGTFGTAEELRRVADETESLENTLAEMIASRCRMSDQEVRDTYFDGQDHWIRAEEALAMGLCDDIYDTAGTEGKIGPDSTPEDVYRVFNNSLVENRAQHEKKMTILDEIRKKPTFANMASEEQILEHIGTLESQASKVPDLENKVAELQSQIAKQQQATDKAFLDAAKNAGKISEEQIPMFMGLLKSDRENTVKLVESMKPAPKNRVIDHIDGNGGDDLLTKSWDDLDKENRLAELKTKYPEVYKNKFNEKFRK